MPLLVAPGEQKSHLLSRVLTSSVQAASGLI